MKTISIRVEEEFFNKMEEQRGPTPKGAFYRNILEDYLKKPEESLNKTEEDLSSRKEAESLKSELAQKEQMRKMMEERIKSMESQLGFLQMEYSKITRVFDQMLLPESEAKSKKWWKFWK
ncbi:MAG: hypothetical protein O8C66_12075 [Candidatus Methanoperedens sp.]|nr:hypothetical protein [Candidatus Methanoperedens sp.]MCZ7371239.1 hypothetical protein [Candidatus Methanoperedens sp.]